jgi:stage III sporulation protein AH
MSKKKKIVVLSCMIALLAVTAVFNFILTGKTNSSVTGSKIETDYFTDYRAERTNARNEEILQLDSIISLADSSSKEYSSALAMKIELTEMTEKEMMLEYLIKAYGFEDVVVVMNLDSDSVNVITKSANLTTEDAIVIYTILQEENVASPENVKIIPIS